ncbi:hypothetical protein [Solirubrobacter ginsenosidimutans]|uniref:hypothetical protein n=1 Tax=Solirubrobacter ginsenosidimutans TaxID=490573 RepID=UPI0022CE23B7|nr:hypothetical protein [Solirubrobacter ginsenosidimutans]
MLQLQRSAGNHAVATALQHRRLQRLSDKEKKDHASELKALRTLYFQNFVDDGAIFEEFRQKGEWQAHVDAFETFAGLNKSINALITAAEEWKNPKERPQAAAQQAAPATPVQETLAEKRARLKGATATAGPATQGGKPPKKNKGQTFVVGTLKPHEGPDGVDPADAPPVVADLPAHLGDIQRSLDNWEVTDHTGVRNGEHLNVQDVLQIVTFMSAKWKAKPFRGRGSGAEHLGKPQLKVSESRRSASGKQLTWHLTLKEDVYYDLPPWIPLREEGTGQRR